jgi:hypothetical protein
MSCRILLSAALLVLMLGSAQARWIVTYQWRQPEPRFIEPRPPTRAEMREQLCDLESGARGYRAAEAAALRCALRYRR